MDQQPFPLDDAFDLTLFRRALEEKGFTQPALADLLNPGDTNRPLEVALDRAVAIRRTSGPSPLCVLARLFVLAQSVPEDTARQALAPVDLGQLAAIGLLRRGAQGIRSELSILPSDDLLLARDFRTAVTGVANRPDYVPGAGPASIVVANLTVRRPVESAFDLGTGLGFQAFLAARHARRVIATDVNPRALSIAALNARLNGIGNVEFRRGSLFEPVEGCQFDLIVSNPPFVISPRAEYCYRDGGGCGASSTAGDTLSEQVVRGARGSCVKAVSARCCSIGTTRALPIGRSGRGSGWPTAGATPGSSAPNTPTRSATPRVGSRNRWPTARRSTAGGWTSGWRTSSGWASG